MNIALIVYLIFLIFIAARSARHVKDIPDFFVARKGASAKAVAGSLVATILGGSAVIGAVDSGARLGGAATWFMLVGALGLLALIPFAGRAYQHGKYALPDLVESLYGKGPRLVASLVIPVAWTGIVAAQIIAAAKLLMTFTALSYTAAAIVAAAVFTGYTLAGGQLSILRTDFLQACLIVLGLVVLAGFALFGGNPENAAPSLSAILQGAPAFPFNTNFSPLDLFLLILTYGTTYTAGPDIFSRMFCAKDTATAKKAIFTAAAILVPVAFVIGFLAVYGVSLGDVQGARITAIANAVLPQPLIPLIALALLSVVLSSADTTLLSSSVIICRLIRLGSTDKEIPACAGMTMKDAGMTMKDAGMTTKGAGMTPLTKARVVILLNGIVALLLALVFTDIIGTLLLALAVYAGAFTIPILWGLLGLKAKPKFVAIAIMAGGVLALAGKLCPALPGPLGAHTGDILMIAAFVVNGIVLAVGRERSPV
jgi:SSS family solute:Na+ symporter